MNTLRDDWGWLPLGRRRRVASAIAHDSNPKSLTSATIIPGTIDMGYQFGIEPPHISKLVTGEKRICCVTSGPISLGYPDKIISQACNYLSRGI